jgi:hypothetical protein
MIYVGRAPSPAAFAVVFDVDVDVKNFFDVDVDVKN